MHLYDRFEPLPTPRRRTDPRIERAPDKGIKAKFDRFIHHPVVEIVILVLIVISVLLIVLELVFRSHPEILLWVENAGFALTSVFAVELLIRFWVARKKRRFFKRYWLDILAVLPLIRPLRFFRILRLLRIFRAGVLIHRRVSMFRGLVKGTVSELTALAALTLTLVLASAILLHSAEVAQTDAFVDLEGSLWFSVYSLIAGEPVGMTPETTMGRWITLVLMLGGMTIFGMFVGTVSAAMGARLSGRLGVTEMDLDELTGHVVVCGWNRSAPTVLRELYGTGAPKGRPVVLITEQAEPPADVPYADIRAEHFYYLSGDYTRIEVLTKVNIHEADCAMLLTDEMGQRTDQDKDARTVLAALTIERLASTIYTVAELTSRQSEDILRMAGVEEIIVGDWYAGVIMGSVSRNPGLVSVLDDVLTAQKGNAFHTLWVPQPLDGSSIQDLHSKLLKEHQAILISWEPALEEDGDLEVNPALDTKVKFGDRLVVLCKNAVNLR